MEWIKIKDRLPHDNIHIKNEHDNVIVYRPHGKIKIHIETVHSAWWMLENHTAEAITHWMPLPQPPKE